MPFNPEGMGNRLFGAAQGGQRSAGQGAGGWMRRSSVFGSPGRFGGGFDQSAGRRSMDDGGALTPPGNPVGADPPSVQPAVGGGFVGGGFVGGGGMGVGMPVDAMPAPISLAPGTAAPATAGGVTPQGGPMGAMFQEVLAKYLAGGQSMPPASATGALPGAMPNPQNNFDAQISRGLWNRS